MPTRDLQAEKKLVDQFFESKGRAPSSPDDWKNIHTATYGSEMPEELSSLPMYQDQGLASTNPQANTGLNYQGTDISDPTLAGAREQALSYNTSGFLDKVKQRLQQKFKPETETLGLGSFSATLGALDPTGVMSGINEKTGQFRKKGALALQALSTANDIYSEQAQRAYDKLNMLEGYRNEYEQEQKTMESEMKDLALSIAQTGKPIPEEILSMLPAEFRGAYETLPAIFAQSGLGSDPYGEGYTASSGWSGNELALEEGAGDAYECGTWARNLGDYAGGQGMGNTFNTKTKWVDKHGTRGTEGIGLGDLVITDASDVSWNNEPLGTGHALIVGAMDFEGNIYAYESNAKGKHNVTFGRWVDPSAIYGYVGGTMQDDEWSAMMNYAQSYEPNLKGKPEEQVSEFDTYAQKYVDGEVNVSQLTAKFGKEGKDKILAISIDLTKTGTKEAGENDREL